MSELDKRTREMGSLRDTRGDRCGIWPVQIGGWPKTACNWHDSAYTEESWAQHNLSRKEVDAHFLQQLLQLSGSNVFKRVTSYGLWGFARLLGNKWWEGDR